MQKLHLYDKIKSPLVTEKSTNLSEQNKIIFKVNVNANKKNILRNSLMYSIEIFIFYIEK